MMAQYSDATLSGAMAWLQLAIMAVPLLIFIARLEWMDWQEAQPEIRRKREWLHRPQSFKPLPH